MKQPQQEAARISQRAIAQFPIPPLISAWPWRNSGISTSIFCGKEKKKARPPLPHTVEGVDESECSAESVHAIRNSIITCYIIVSPSIWQLNKERFSDNSLCLFGSVLICLSSVNFHSFHPAPASQFICFSIDFFFSSCFPFK